MTNNFDKLEGLDKAKKKNWKIFCDTYTLFFLHTRNYVLLIVFSLRLISLYEGQKGIFDRIRL